MMMIQIKPHWSQNRHLHTITKAVEINWNTLLKLHKLPLNFSLQCLLTLTTGKYISLKHVWLVRCFFSGGVVFWWNISMVLSKCWWNFFCRWSWEEWVVCECADRKTVSLHRLFHLHVHISGSSWNTQRDIKLRQECGKMENPKERWKYFIAKQSHKLGFQKWKREQDRDSTETGALYFNAEHKVCQIMGSFYFLLNREIYSFLLCVNHCFLKIKYIFVHTQFLLICNHHMFGARLAIL